MYTYTVKYCAQLCPTHCGPTAPLSMESSNQEYWNGLPLPTPRGLPDLGTQPMSLASPTLVGSFFTTNTTWEDPMEYYLAMMKYCQLQYQG